MSRVRGLEDDDHHQFNSSFRHARSFLKSPSNVRQSVQEFEPAADRYRGGLGCSPTEPAANLGGNQTAAEQCQIGTAESGAEQWRAGQGIELSGPIARQEVRLLEQQQQHHVWIF